VGTRPGEAAAAADALSRTAFRGVGLSQDGGHPILRLRCCSLFLPPPTFSSVCWSDALTPSDPPPFFLFFSFFFFCILFSLCRATVYMEDNLERVRSARAAAEATMAMRRAVAAEEPATAPPAPAPTVSGE